MIKQLISKANLNQAYLQVYRNKGAAGIDRVHVTELKSVLEAHGKQNIEQIERETYQMSPILGVEIPKSHGKTRLLGIPTVVDRVYQQALHQVLQPIFEMDFHEHSYGFRPKRNAHQAITQSHGKIIYSSLFKAAWQTLQQFGANPKHLGGMVGMIAVLHTWGQNLSLHPHLHCIVPGGGISKSGQWKLVKNKGKYLFNVKAMSFVFRAKYVTLLRTSELEIPQEIYNQIFKKKWVVFANQPFARPENVIEYLGRYTHKIAISNHRILKIDQQKRQVIFRAKDFRHGDKKIVLTLTTQEFIRRFALHVLPKGFTRIRHYGILSSCWKKDKLPKLQAALALKETAVLTPEKILLHRQCPSCKKGRLHTVLLFDARGPPPNWQHLFKEETLIINTSRTCNHAGRNCFGKKLKSVLNRQLKALKRDAKASLNFFYVKYLYCNSTQKIVFPIIRYRFICSSGFVNKISIFGLSAKRKLSYCITFLFLQA